MGQVKYRTYYQIVWATLNRQSVISPNIAQLVYSAICKKAGDLGCFIHAINGAGDHVHLAITIPPRLCVSTVVGQLKGFAAHCVNQVAKVGFTLQWQDGFGVDTVSEFDLPRIIRYIQNQAEHHSNNSLVHSLEHTPK